MRRLPVAVLAAALALALLLLAGSPGVAGATPVAATYRLDLRRASEGVVEVSVHLEASSGLRLRLDDAFGGDLAVDLPSHLRGLRAFSGEGTEIPVYREGDGWSVAGGGTLRLSYEVDLSGYRAGTPYLESLSADLPAWPYFPLLREDLAYLPGYALFLRPDPLPEGFVELEVKLPEGWRAVLPGEGSGIQLDELVGNPLLAGKLVVEERGSITLVMPESGAPPPATREEFSRRLDAVLSRAASLPGSRKGDGEETLRVFLLRHGEGDRLKDAYYPLASFADTVVIPMPLGMNLLSESSLEAVTRGVAALYLSRSLRLEPESRWLLEGAAWYFQDLLPYEAGIWGGSLLWDHFSVRYDGYRRAREALSFSLSEAGDPKVLGTEAASLLACGGAAACAAVDAGLRARGELAGDLVAWLRDLGDLSREGRALTNEDLRRLLETRSATSWSSFFADYVQGRQEIPPSLISALRVAPETPGIQPEETPSKPASVSDWVLLAIAVAVVLAIPFVLEPYTMRPRKPGFLQKKLED